MEKITLDYPGKKSSLQFAQVGVVSSGDMEVLFIPNDGDSLKISIVTSVDGSRQRWERIFERIGSQSGLPSGSIVIHDFGATPGVARMRLEQVFEEEKDE